MNGLSDNPNIVHDLMSIMEQIIQLRNSSEPHTSMINKILKIATEAIHCETSAICVNRGDQWIVHYAYGFSEEICGLVLNDNEGKHARLAITTKQTVIINDTYTDTRVNTAYIKEWGIRSVIVVPIIIREAVAGVVFYNFYRKIDVFDELTIVLANHVSSSLSTLLQNAKLHSYAVKEHLQRKKAVEKYKNLFNSIDEGFAIIEMIFDSEKIATDYCFVETNAAFEKQSGIKNALGKHIRDINLHSETIEIFAKVALTGAPDRFEVESKKLDRWFSIYAFKLDPDDITNVGVLLKDITQQVLAKDALVHTLKMQEEFFVNTSHELKTPLTLIYSASQLMENYLAKGNLEEIKDKMYNKLNIINQNCFRMTKLINNILDLSKLDAGALKLNLSNENIVEITKYIVYLASVHSNGKHIDIRFSSNTESKTIAIDVEKIERVLLNLISNAIKFSPPSGIINVNVVDKDNAVEIFVEDQGTGIGKEHLDSLFQRFYQADKSLHRNAEGAGIGLSIVKSIVDLHQGSIEIESEVGKGSIFKIILPNVQLNQKYLDPQMMSLVDKAEIVRIEFSDIE